MPPRCKKFLRLWGFFFVYFSCLPQAKDIQVRFYGNSKLSLGVIVSVSACLSLYVSPVMDPAFNLSYDRLQHHCNAECRLCCNRTWMEGWMDGKS